MATVFWHGCSITMASTFPYHFKSNTWPSCTKPACWFSLCMLIHFVGQRVTHVRWCPLCVPTFIFLSRWLQTGLLKQGVMGQVRYPTTPNISLHTPTTQHPQPSHITFSLISPSRNLMGMLSPHHQGSRPENSHSRVVMLKWGQGPES